MNWGIEDFLTAALLLSVGALALWVIRTRLRGRKARFIAVGVMIAGLLLIWAELAVGIIGG